MRNLGVLTGFLPLIVFAILSGSTVERTQVALLAACIVSLLVGYKTLRRGFYLDWANFLMFAVALVCLSVLNITMIVDYMGIMIYLVLSLVAFGSLFAGAPFTAQYARDMVDRSVWDTPAFKSVNRFMTGVWGGVFVVDLLLITYSKTGTGPYAPFAGILVYAVLVLGLLFTIYYPEYFRKKHPRTVP
jgi:hypothetical protein